MENIIEIKGLKKSYGSFEAVKDVTFNVKKGEIFGFLGPNGAGKSTLLNILTNRIPATSGKVLIDGQPNLNNDDALGKIYLMSEPNLYSAPLRPNKP